MRRAILMVATMALTLLVASGVALAVTKIGGPGPDTLRGTKGDDKLAGLGGDDKLFALRGNDIEVALHPGDFCLVPACLPRVAVQTETQVELLHVEF